MKIYWTFLLAILLTATGFAQAGPAGAAKGDKPASVPVNVAANPDYVIGESDMLAINVWHEQELSRVLPVRADGKISLPLIGDITASGLSPTQLQAEIGKKLQSYMSNPEVTVIVQDARSQYFTIVGEVQKPGSYPLGQRLTVLDGIALAGGCKDFAKSKRIYILRPRPDGTTERMPFNYKHALGGDTKDNFMLMARDTIVVP
jgi:polysaccharide export outer membrane protein